MHVAFVIIHNPAAGLNGAKRLGKYLSHFDTLGLRYEVVETARPGHAVELGLHHSQRQEVSYIGVSGGDGTIKEVAQGVGELKPMIILPNGTANVLAIELGYPSSFQVTYEACQKLINDQKFEFVYSSRVSRPDFEAISLCWVGVGFDAATIQNTRPSHKKSFGKLAFVPATFKAMMSDNYTIKVGPFAEYGWVVCTNISHYAGKFILADQADILERKLDVIGMKASGFWARCLDVCAMAFGLFRLRTETLDMSSDDWLIGNPKTPVHVDGDYIGKGEVQISPYGRHRFLTLRQR